MKKTSVLLIALLMGCLIAACERSGKKIEKNAVIVNVSITPEEAAEGIVKLVRAPDSKYYNMVIPKDTKNGKYLMLPPKIAERYSYPLYFKIAVLPEGTSPPDDLLNRKRK